MGGVCGYQPTFANTTGGTQEEIIFGMSPEMDVITLFLPPLEGNAHLSLFLPKLDNEAVIIKGPQKIALYTGYGLDLELDGFTEQRYPNLDKTKWNDRFIVAIDAFPFPEVDPFEVCNFSCLPHFFRGSIRRLSCCRS